jgi:phage terminase large subunit-like protein
VITTAGDNPNGVGHELYATALRIKNSEVDQLDTHVCIHEADAGCTLDDPEAWRAANPSLGITIRSEDIAKDAESAIKNPEQENTFRRYTLNQWVTVHTRWLSSVDWAICDAAEFDQASLIGKPCCLGLDLGMVDDSSALVAAFPMFDKPDKPNQEAPVRMALLAKFFLPEDGIEKKEESDQVAYRRWAELGHYVLTPGNVTDYEFIKQQIRDWCKLYKVAEVPYDKYNAYELGPALKAEGLPMEVFPQTWDFISPASKEFARLVRAGRVLANHNPVLRWMAANVMIRVNATGNIRPDKAASKLHIDGIIAAIMAVARALVVKPKQSIYLTRGPIVLTAGNFNGQSINKSDGQHQSTKG